MRRRCRRRSSPPPASPRLVDLVVRQRWVERRAVAMQALEAAAETAAAAWLAAAWLVAVVMAATEATRRTSVGRACCRGRTWDVDCRSNTTRLVGSRCCKTEVQVGNKGYMAVAAVGSRVCCNRKLSRSGAEAAHSTMSRTTAGGTVVGRWYTWALPGADNKSMSCTAVCRCCPQDLEMWTPP